MADTHVLQPRSEARILRRVLPAADDVRGTTYAAFRILQTAFVLAPLVAGVDKFFHGLVNWNQYLAPAVERLLPVPGPTFMRAVGVVEIAAAVLVALAPRVGGWVVAAWLWAITLNLVIAPGYDDLALRDLGLSAGAVALALLARVHARPRAEPAPASGLDRPTPREYPPLFPPL